MKNALLLSLLLCFISLISCVFNSYKKKKTVEIWKSELIRIKTSNNDMIDSLKNHDQYLYLFPNGDAHLLDSLKNGIVQKSKTNWEIIRQDGKYIFLFGYGKESEGILGIAYPIITKNEWEFKMLFDSITETHIWNLKRVK